MQTISSEAENLVGTWASNASSWVGSLFSRGTTVMELTPIGGQVNELSSVTQPLLEDISQAIEAVENVVPSTVTTVEQAGNIINALANSSNPVAQNLAQESGLFDLEAPPLDEFGEVIEEIDPEVSAFLAEEFGDSAEAVFGSAEYIANLATREAVQAGEMGLEMVQLGESAAEAAEVVTSAVETAVTTGASLAGTILGGIASFGVGLLPLLGNWMISEADRRHSEYLTEHNIDPHGYVTDDITPLRGRVGFVKLGNFLYPFNILDADEQEYVVHWHDITHYRRLTTFPISICFLIDPPVIHSAMTPEQSAKYLPILIHADETLTQINFYPEFSEGTHIKNIETSKIGQITRSFVLNERNRVVKKYDKHDNYYKISYNDGTEDWLLPQHFLVKNELLQRYVDLQERVRNIVDFQQTQQEIENMIENEVSLDEMINQGHEWNDTLDDMLNQGQQWAESYDDFAPIGMEEPIPVVDEQSVTPDDPQRRLLSRQLDSFQDRNDNTVYVGDSVVSLSMNDEGVVTNITLENAEDSSEQTISVEVAIGVNQNLFDFPAQYLTLIRANYTPAEPPALPPVIQTPEPTGDPSVTTGPDPDLSVTTGPDPDPSATGPEITNDSSEDSSVSPNISYDLIRKGTTYTYADGYTSFWPDNTSPVRIPTTELLGLLLLAFCAV